VAVAAGETLEAGDAFVGLGYITAVVLVVLLIALATRLLTEDWKPGVREPSAAKGAEESEQSLIRDQLRVGALLIAFGALVAVVAGIVVSGEEVAVAIGTAVIGAGAALLPPGAAAGAAERLTKLREPKGRTADRQGAPEGQRPGGRDRPAGGGT
jgi:heme A synthase